MDTSIEPDAFRQIYPHEYLQRFLAQDVRSDGRPLGRARSLRHGCSSATRTCTPALRSHVLCLVTCSVTTEAVSSAEGSCLAKAGRTAALAGVKALVGPPSVEEPTRGQLHVTLELPALCNPDLRPGKCVALRVMSGR
jgi:exosome complex component RRP43